MYLCLTILAVAMAGDIVSGRIPNALCLSGILLSQLYVLISDQGLPGALCALLSGIAVMIILYPLFAIGCMGGGDIKLMMMLPAYLGLKLTLIAVFYAFVAGALIGIIKLIRRGIFTDRLITLKNYICDIKTTGKLRVYDTFPGDKTGSSWSNRIHFTIPLYAGVIIAYGGLILT